MAFVLVATLLRMPPAARKRKRCAEGLGHRAWGTAAHRSPFRSAMSSEEW